MYGGQGAMSDPQPGERSAYRDNAENYRQRKANRPTKGLTQEEWEFLCEKAAAFMETLADRHEQAIREGRAEEFLHRKPAGNDTA